MQNILTDSEWADGRARHAMHSAVVALVTGSAASIAGCWYYAMAFGDGTLAAGFVTVSATVFLVLGIHLRSALGAARAVDRVDPAAYRLAGIGGWVLVTLTLTVNYSTLHALAAAQGLEPLASALIPLAPDIAVVVATAAIFTIKPATRPVRRRPAPAAPRTAPTRTQKPITSAIAEAPAETPPAPADTSAAPAVAEAPPASIETRAAAAPAIESPSGPEPAAAGPVLPEPSAAERRLGEAVAAMGVRGSPTAQTAAAMIAASRRGVRANGRIGMTRQDLAKCFRVSRDTAAAILTAAEEVREEPEDPAGARPLATVGGEW